MEQLWERSREGRRETNSEAEYREPERRHGKPGRKEGRKTWKRKRKGALWKPLGGGNRKKGKEEQRLSSQNPKLKRTKERENSGGQKVNGKKRKATEAERS